MKTSECKGCGRKIVWAKDANTLRPIPLDAIAPVYTVYIPEGENEATATPRAMRNKAALVSHFCVCSAREQFSNKSRKASE